MKIEIIISVWDDNGDFFLRDRIIGDNLEEQVKFSLDNIKTKIEQKEANKYAIGEDDDIPF